MCAIETSSRYLFHCPKYQITRYELLDSLSDIPTEINTNLLVFGSDQLSDELNIHIFKSTQMYIIKSKQF